MQLTKKCPACRSTTLTVETGQIRCTTPGCSFLVRYTCPICNSEMSGETCGSCNNIIPPKKIHYLIENSLVVDYQKRCQFCNGPTIHRKDVNMTHRCFHFPKCSGQVGLFTDSRESLVFLDFETTGLEVAQNEIIEIGALKIDEEGFEHALQILVKPIGPIDSRITEITGITDAMVASAPGIQEATKTLLDFIGDAKIVSHNAEFDLPWLIAACRRHEMRLKTNSVICTLVWARKSHEPHCSLTSLTRKYNIGHLNAHRALADAVATKELYFIFQNVGASARPEVGIADYEELTTKLCNRKS